MKVRKILGGVVIPKIQKNHFIGKTDNGRYTVGHIGVGDVPRPEIVFETLEQAFDYWTSTLPVNWIHKPAISTTPQYRS